MYDCKQLTGGQGLAYPTDPVQNTQNTLNPQIRRLPTPPHRTGQAGATGPVFLKHSLEIWGVSR